MSEARRDDDDLGLDESLSSMRSMWREMRDEEPSDKGMAALLAAARVKAEEMKPKRSWWAVLFEQLRRPPVLAMATVVVLIGGAVVISQRDDMRAETEAVAVDMPAAPTVGSEDRVSPRERVPEQAGTPVKEPLPTTVVEGSTTDEEVAVAPPVERPRPTTKPGRKHGPRSDESKPTDGPPLESKGSSLEPNFDAKKLDVQKAPMAIASGEDDLQPKGGAVGDSTSAGTAAAPQQDSKSVMRKPLPAIEGEDRAAKDTSIAQLVKQCEAAAAKNDCAAVRSIAAKIARQDPQTYKNRVLKSSSIARCLEPPAPVDATEADD